MGCLKSGLDNFLTRSIQTSVVNTHTVTYKPMAPADIPAQLKFKCSCRSDYHIDLNSVRLLLRIKLIKIDGSDIENAEPNTVGCVNNLFNSMFSSLTFLSNGKPVTLQETNYHYKAYVEKLLNYGFDASTTHQVSRFWYLDSPRENTGYAKRLIHLSNGKTLEKYGRLHGDLFNSDKILINGVDMSIKLTRAPDPFYLLTPSNDNKVLI